MTTLTHREPFASNADYNRIQMRYVAGDGIPNGANGRCVRSNLGGVARRHFYDHFGRLLFETDEAGQLLNLYFHRDAHLVALRNAGDTTHFYHFDAHGNTLALTDERARISAAHRYLPYGEMAGGFSRTENPFTFMGRDGVRDVSNGLHMTPHRFYDARCGRFLQYDPIGPVGGFHPYAYAAGNPIDFSDPLGLINTAKVTAGTINTIVGFPLALFGIGTANPLSCLQMEQIRQTNSVGMLVRWQSATGKFYRLQRATNLTEAGAFVTLRTNIPATPILNSYTDSTAVGAGPWSYRIQLE